MYLGKNRFSSVYLFFQLVCNHEQTNELLIDNQRLLRIVVHQLNCNCYEVNLNRNTHTFLVRSISHRGSGPLRLFPAKDLKSKNHHVTNQLRYGFSSVDGTTFRNYYLHEIGINKTAK